MSKSPDAFRTISEVADWLGVQAHVLRFWESKFTQVKPVKRAGGRRYYRPNDMRLLGGIKKLLHEDGITIKGAQRILREQGVAHVAALSPPLDDGSEGPAEVIEAKVVPMPTPQPVAPVEQFKMDLAPDAEPAPAPLAEPAASSEPPLQSQQPTAPKPATPSVDPDIMPSTEIDEAPLMGGIASQAWNVQEFDPQLLRNIAPIAKDLRAWLDRVETRIAG
ncbi:MULTISPECIES: MerR family transcriptional regulator [unclassified Ruegeria]|uniref:MerR family transcriptional regulator n=1 Tax=unclassified Ruegeria TaxID=2625375 RepID=UPI0014896B11|nr:MULTISPECIES: MerR family transcriptional regulator [unclassified Ruegeria]